MILARRLTLWATLLVALTALPGSALVYLLARERILQQTGAEIAASTASVLEIQIDKLRGADASLAALARLVEERYRNSAPAEEDALDAFVARDDDGGWRSLRGRFDGSREAGIFLPPDGVRSPEARRLHVAVKRVLDVFGAAATKQFTNTWWLGPERSEVIFDPSYPDFVYMMRADNDYSDMPWMSLTRQAGNPKGETRWTPALYDPVSRTWMVSAVRPLVIDGAWQGALGHDVPISRVLQTLTEAGETYAGEHHFLLDATGRFVLAGPWQRELEASKEPFHLDAAREPGLARLFEAVRAQRHAPRYVNLGRERYLAVSVPLEPLAWRYCRLVPLSAALGTLNQLYLTAAAVLAIVALTLAIGISTAVRRTMLTPLAALAAAARQWGSGRLDARIGGATADEFGAIAQTFNQMAEDLERDRLQLRNSEGNYRAVVSAVREIILRLDTAGALVFVNPAWAELTRYPLESSLGRRLVEFVSEEDRDAMAATIEAICTGFYEDAELDARIVASDGRRLHVHASLSALRGEGEEVIGVAGSLDDETARVYAEGAEKLLRDMNRQMLAGASMEEIVDYCAGTLARLFDYPLVCLALRDRHGQAAVHSVAGRLAGAVSAQFGPTREASVPALSCTIGFGSGASGWSAAAPTDHPVFSRLAALGLASGLALPLDDYHDVGGVLLFSSDQDAAFEGAAAARLAALSRRVAHALQAALDQHWLRLQKTALESASNAIFITDCFGTIEWVNSAFCRLSGYAPTEVLGRNPRVLKSGRHDADYYGEMWRTILAGQTWRMELTNRRKDGSLYTVLQTVTPFASNGAGVTHFVAVHEDITALKESEARVEHLATHDWLTQLPNRMLLEDQLELALEQTRHAGRRIAVIFLDLDRFKHINDSLGHTMGDQLLQVISMRLASCVRREDTVCRLGGDEFVIVLNGVNREENVTPVAEKLLETVAKPLFLEGQEFSITASVGIAVFPGDGDTVETLLRNADTAMYRAKDEGRNTFRYYTAEMNERVRQRLHIEHRLRSAVKEGSFELHFQPQIELATGRVAGAEALVRWRDAESGELVAPARFIPIAEETGLISGIGAWVIDETLAQARRWRESGHPAGLLSINVSTRQFFEPDFVPRLERSLEAASVMPREIGIEITESIMIHDVEEAIRILEQLKGLGVKLAIDDFGTGYSSLGYLRRLPIDTVKLDMAFVRHLTENARDRAIAGGLIALSHELGLVTVAEGVETEAQRDLLRELGCDQIQGYIYSRPLAAQGIEGWFAKRQAGAGAPSDYACG
ncbi:MAG: EAL domain-containing protein [Gammaproteobacteria bacterium]|nr:EAL domain-containing protein [Gammaproteobacteria bacterium]MBI5617594.1 EAL domain-containing protein [Gammaproteobacteria bacterium]